MLPTDYNSDSEEEDDYPSPEENVRATYSNAKFARIQPTIQKTTSQMDVEPEPTRTRAGQFITRTDQQSIDSDIGSLQDKDCSGLPDLETDNDEQERVNAIPQFELWMGAAWTWSDGWELLGRLGNRRVAGQRRT
jgi:hypothetical protein